MGLTEYRKKRSFHGTPEPTGGKTTGQRLRFVIQKHDASRLHYDFRLELGGVMKSWAVPKGPSMNPAEKRLAMMVEDHPLDYRNFEGIIPEGNYGAGTVIIWDEGYYEPSEPVSGKKAREKSLAAALAKGSVKIRLHGRKIKGEFALVRTKGKEGNSWLLIKHRDDYATTENILDDGSSVRSGKTIEEMTADTTARKWKSNRSSDKPAVTASTQKKSMKGKRTSKSTVHPAEIIADTAGVRKASLPKDIKPMLATLVDKPFDKPGWLYEVKWDGYRAISYLKGGDIEIRSRNNKDFSKKFYPVFEALQRWGIDAVVDGEIIVVNENGEPDFNALQEWRSEADGQLIYYVFDLLWFGGYSLMDVPLARRKEILSKIIPPEGIIRLSENFDITGTAFFSQAEKMGLEGIMAKKSDSVYKPDHRGKDWLKIKTQKQQEAIIGGYTLNENSGKKFSALLMGVYENNELVFIGPVGTGFTSALQSEILRKLKPLQTSKCPFAETPDYNKPSRFRPNPPKAEVVWVKPQVVAEISYRARSSDGSMRHPSFKGLREDKNPTDVRMEDAMPLNEVIGSKNSTPGKKMITPPDKAERKTFLNPNDETQVRRIDGHDLKFTNLGKIFWPEEGLTKRDMLNFYYQVVPFMLPYMKDRPQTLNRFPNGIHGKSFYQKDVTGKVPSWINTYPYFSEGDEREKHFLVATDEASLLYIASLGCIEMNPWSSRVSSPDHPDWCIIDLDPGDKTTFNDVIEAANVTKEILDEIGVSSFCKTSGSTGLHIYIPLGAKYLYEDSREFARAIVKVVHGQLSTTTSIERKVSDRRGRMYLDFLQNRPQATVAGPYSLRPKPGAPVSMPLHWEEVKKGLTIRDFTMTNSMARLRTEGDLFKGVLGEGIDMDQALVALMKSFGKVKE